MTEKQAEKKDEGPRAFARFLEQVGEGEAHTELSTTLHKLMGVLHEHARQFGGKAKGAITLTVGFAVEAGSKTSHVDVAYEIKTKEPKAKRGGSVFFLTEGKNLTVENPRQQELPLREVKAPPVAELPAAAEQGARDV